MDQSAAFAWAIAVLHWFQGFDTSTWAAVVSAAAACVAALYARLAYRSNQREATQLEPHLIPYLFDGYQRHDHLTGKRTFAFSLSLSNGSRTDNCIVRIELRVSYRRKEACLTISTDHESALAQAFDILDTQTLKVPIRMDGRQASVGWAFFRFHEGVLKDAAIDTYEIRLTDSRGEETRIPVGIVREYVLEETTSED